MNRSIDPLLAFFVTQEGTSFQATGVIDSSLSGMGTSWLLDMDSQPIFSPDIWIPLSLIDKWMLRYLPHITLSFMPTQPMQTQGPVSS